MLLWQFHVVLHHTALLLIIIPWQHYPQVFITCFNILQCHRKKCYIEFEPTYNCSFICGFKFQQHPHTHAITGVCSLFFLSSLVLNLSQCDMPRSRLLNLRFLLTILAESVNLWMLSHSLSPTLPPSLPPSLFLSPSSLNTLLFSPVKHWHKLGLPFGFSRSCISSFLGVFSAKS